MFNNFSSPVDFICGAIGAIQNTTAAETAKLCAQYLGPALRLLNFNYLPIPIDPYLTKSTEPRQGHLHRGEPGPRRVGTQADRPRTAPGGVGLHRAGDVAAPPGFGPPGAPCPSRCRCTGAGAVPGAPSPR